MELGFAIGCTFPGKKVNLIFLSKCKFVSRIIFTSADVTSCSLQFSFARFPHLLPFAISFFPFSLLSPIFAWHMLFLRGWVYQWGDAKCVQHTCYDVKILLTSTFFQNFLCLFLTVQRKNLFSRFSLFSPYSPRFDPNPNWNFRIESSLGHKLLAHQHPCSSLFSEE